MYRFLYCFILMILLVDMAMAQRVLHFTATSGFDHGTRQVSLSMFEALCAQLNCTITDDATGEQFNTIQQLSQFDVVVFSNTSGNAILNSQQQSNFEQWVANGGHVMGLHAATDTYRHSTANGNNTGAWDFYAELIGASVQENPNHVAGTPTYTMVHVGNHPSTSNLPSPWPKAEEYYYWEGGYYGGNNIAVLEVEPTVGPNGQVNSYDAARPISWFRQLPNGSKVFYTALGHDPSNYSADPHFRTHIADALQWLLTHVAQVEWPISKANTMVYPNPTMGEIRVQLAQGLANGNYIFYAMDGRVLQSGQITSNPHVIDLSHFESGAYILQTSEWHQQILIAK